MKPCKETLNKRPLYTLVAFCDHFSSITKIAALNVILGFCRRNPILSL